MSNTVSATVFTKRDLIGRMVVGPQSGYIVSAWVASRYDRERTGRAGCVYLWPDGLWRWLDEIEVSGEKAAILPALNKEQRDRARRDLAALLAPLGKDEWVANIVGYKHRSSIFFIRQELGIPPYREANDITEHNDILPSQRVAVVELWLDGVSINEIAKRVGIRRTATQKILNDLGRRKRDRTHTRRAKIIKNVKRELSDVIPADWPKTRCQLAQTWQ